MLAPAGQSMVVTGTVREWGSWTPMAFPASGADVVPEVVDLAGVDRERDTGIHLEPNVCLRHA